MRTCATLVLVLGVALGATAQQEPTFRATTQIVSVPTTVTDGQGRLVPNLEQDQFSILLTVVILTAVVPTLIAQRFFQPALPDTLLSPRAQEPEPIGLVGEEGT